MRFAILILAIALSGCAHRTLVKKDQCQEAGEHLLCSEAWKVN